VLPDVPTMGTRVDLRGEGVDAALTVVCVTLRAISDGPCIRPPSIEVALHWEPHEAAEIASAADWRAQAPPEPEKVSHMKCSDSAPEVSPASVRTLSDGLLVGSLCPICRLNELWGRQTVCSAACRRERSRQRQAAALQAEVASLGQGIQVLRARLDTLAERVDRITQRPARRREL